MQEYPHTTRVFRYRLRERTAPCASSRQREAFTLIELLVVTALIALLISILLPSLSTARKAAQGATCLSNLRQFVMAAHTYAQNYKDLYPIAHYRVKSKNGLLVTDHTWEVITAVEWTRSSSGEWSKKSVSRPGLLWQGRMTMQEIHQCPLYPYNAGDNWGNAMPYTGYNYNTSYIGHGEGESNDPNIPILPPARMTSVRHPSQCALFGDGEYEGGANKFMRSPFKDPGNGGDVLDGRYAGTQGYRHLGKTNVAFCDGHAQSWASRYDNTYENERKNVSPNTGFLSPDNSLYDLK